MPPPLRPVPPPITDDEILAHLEASKLRKRNPVVMIVLAVLALAVGRGLYTTFINPPPRVPVATQQARPARDPNTAYVWVATEREVKSRLKYPDSAEFPGVLEYPDHVRRQADGSYLVTGWVKAMTPLGMKQMTFAATLREVMPQRFAATEVVINE